VVLLGLIIIIFMLAVSRCRFQSPDRAKRAMAITIVIGKKPGRNHKVRPASFHNKRRQGHESILIG
jgi:hypothetical protein